MARTLHAREPMRRGFGVLVWVLTLLGCGGAELDAVSADNARLRARLASLEGEMDPEPRYPIGDVFVSRGERADLGWIDLAVKQVRACGPGQVGVAVELVHRGDRAVEIGGLVGKLYDRRGGALESTFDFQHCPSGDHELDVGGKAVVWLKFKGGVATADLLELKLEQPDGLAVYRVLLALHGDTKKPEMRESVRRQPLARIRAKAGPVVTDFYRFAVTDVKICEPPSSPSAKLSVGIEVVIENRSNVPFTIDADAKLRDGRGYVYDGAWRFRAGDCGPTLRYQKLAPGDRVRGYVGMFDVPPDAGKLVLEYGLRGTGLETHNVRLAIGALPAPPLRLQPAEPPGAPREWTKPKSALGKTASGVHVTVTRLAPCTEKIEDGRFRLGVELLIDNRSDKPVQLAWSGSVEDAQHYRYGLSGTYESTGPCNPILSLDKPLAPGEKVRGWLNSFRVPVKTGNLKLRYDVHVVDPQAPAFASPTPEGVILDLGQLR